MKKPKIDAKALQKIIAEQKKNRKVIRLHKMPEQIKQSIKDLREMAEEKDLQDLFEDIDVLVNWALARLPMLTPEEMKEEGQDNLPQAQK